MNRQIYRIWEDEANVLYIGGPVTLILQSQSSNHKLTITFIKRQDHEATSRWKVITTRHHIASPPPSCPGPSQFQVELFEALLSTTKHGLTHETLIGGCRPYLGLWVQILLARTCVGAKHFMNKFVYKFN